MALAGITGEIGAALSAAKRIAPKGAEGTQGLLPTATGAVDGAPRIVLVGIGSNPPKTTESIVNELASRGLERGRDVIATRYRDLRVGKDRGFVRLASGTGEDGVNIAGKGAQALFLFRGGGNLKPHMMEKIRMLEAVEGATVLSDAQFIAKAGSKARTNEILSEAGVALPRTIDVHGEQAAADAVADVLGSGGAETAVLKKVNSLGGKDVHFVKSGAEAAEIVRREPDADYVVQEFLAAAKDQDVRVHMVWNSDKGDFEIKNSYVRNRLPGAITPNLANDGFATPYTVSPWEEHQALTSARALAAGSEVRPVHVALDLFPRRPITASSVEANVRDQAIASRDAVSRQAMVAGSDGTAVIGEAASSGGTKGTELTLGGENPVAEAIVDEILRRRDAITAAG